MARKHSRTGQPLILFTDRGNQFIHTFHILYSRRFDNNKFVNVVSRHLAAKWENTYSSGVDSPFNSATSLLDSIEVLVLLDLLGAKNPVLRDFYASTSWLFSELVE